MRSGGLNIARVKKWQCKLSSSELLAFIYLYNILSQQLQLVVIKFLVVLFLSMSFVPLLAEPVGQISFGATLSLSSSSAPFAKACARGIEFAVEDVNSAGGVAGKKLKVKIEDFQEVDLKRAASAAHKLIDVDKVAVLFTNWSEDAEVVAPIAERKGLVSMTLGAGGPGASRFASSAFRATGSDSETAIASVKAELSTGARRGCFVTAQTSYYVDISKDILSSWQEQGGTVAFQQDLPYGASDVRFLVTRMKGANCDSVFIWASPTTIGLVISELRRQRLKARRILPWFADTKEVLDRTLGDDQVYSLYRWVFEDQEFRERYQKRSGEDFMRPAGNCYDGIRLMAAVISKVGTERHKIIEELMSMPAYQGVTGPFVITPERERSGEKTEAFQIKNGKLLPLS